jgi:hypothetical protein
LVHDGYSGWQFTTGLQVEDSVKLTNPHWTSSSLLTATVPSHVQVVAALLHAVRQALITPVSVSAKQVAKHCW